MASMNTIPNEILYGVFGYLDYLDFRLSIPFVSHHFRTLALAKSKDINNVLLDDRFVPEKPKIGSITTDEARQNNLLLLMELNPYLPEDCEQSSEGLNDTDQDVEIEKVAEEDQNGDGEESMTENVREDRHEDNEDEEDTKSNTLEVKDYVLHPVLSSIKYNFCGDLKNIFLKDRKGSC